MFVKFIENAIAPRYPRFAVYPSHSKTFCAAEAISGLEDGIVFILRYPVRRYGSSYRLYSWIRPHYSKFVSVKAASFNPARIFDRATLLHLRLPFSFFLLPVFCFGISQASNIHAINTWTLFVALHFFIYPGSNVYNSFMDRDTGSIGGLEHPPPVTPSLLYASVYMDVAGLLLCAVVRWELAALVSGYVAFSKAYSWHGIRLKKYPWLGWVMVLFFQGGYTFLMTHMAAENNFTVQWFNEKNLLCLLIASLFIGGYYPLTQIYQHQEDSERGDQTVSYRLGVRGTFVFSGVLFALAAAVCYVYFTTFYTLDHFLLFLLMLLPVVLYFLYWAAISFKDQYRADYRHAMRMTFISSLSMIVAFALIWWMNLTV
ncbi:MAG: hypothetical protein EOP49_04755 [Sphingobacteriales bacterium]|nr:MAG: hypothetical protein EOP49_04755 [Sphingobacteriales bacterium]